MSRSVVLLLYPGVLFYCCSLAGRHARCVEIALKHGADVNNVSLAGEPLLVCACESADVNAPTCLKLLEAGADPNSTDQARFLRSSLQHLSFNCITHIELFLKFQ